MFDIRQGVAVAFFVKRGDSNMDGQDEQDGPKVHHAERFGSRESKYDWLRAHDRDGTEWQALKPASPHYLFVPRDEALEAAYNRFMPVTEVFPVHSVGIVTARDSLTIRWSADEVWNTVTVFSGMEPELARQGYELGKDVQDWKVSWRSRTCAIRDPPANGWCRFCTGRSTCATPITPGAHGGSSAGRAPRS